MKKTKDEIQYDEEISALIREDEALSGWWWGMSQEDRERMMQESKQLRPGQWLDLTSEEIINLDDE
jgi:hypothetical protein